jgi:thiol-disulfide isomerase/thioredoxin
LPDTGLINERRRENLKHRNLVVALFLIAVLTLAFQNGLFSQVFAKEAPVIGGTAPGFFLPELSGKVVDLSKVIKNNKVTVVNFWATWCPPCRREIPEFIKFYRKYAGEKVAVIAVNLQESPANVKKFAKKNGMNFPIVTDVTGKVGDKYQISGIPTTIFIDRRGKIFYRIEGAIKLKTLEAKIRPLLGK